jgi:hypothetical protein
MNTGNEWKKENILKFATWNVQGIAHKEQDDDILAKKKTHLPSIKVKVNYSIIIVKGKRLVFTLQILST